MVYMNLHAKEAHEIAYDGKCLAALLQQALSASAEDGSEEESDIAYGAWFVLELIKESFDHLNDLRAVKHGEDDPAQQEPKAPEGEMFTW